METVSMNETKETVSFFEGLEILQRASDKAKKRRVINEVLEKIRAEIVQLRIHKAQFLTSDNKTCIDSQEVLNIIDKYRAESEEE